MIQGLFNRLPEAGSVWNIAERKKWLTTAEHMFDLIYVESSEASRESDSDHGV